MNISRRVRFAAAGAAALVLSFSVAAPSSATDDPRSDKGVTCDQLGYHKVDRPVGMVTLDVGTLAWAGNAVTFHPTDGGTVKVCVKGGSETPIKEITLSGDNPTYMHPQAISHIGWRLPSSGTPTPTPEQPTEPTTAPRPTPSESAQPSPSESDTPTTSPSSDDELLPPTRIAAGARSSEPDPNEVLLPAVGFGALITGVGGAMAFRWINARRGT